MKTREQPVVGMKAVETGAEELEIARGALPQEQCWLSALDWCLAYR